MVLEKFHVLGDVNRAIPWSRVLGVVMKEDSNERKNELFEYLDNVCKSYFMKILSFVLELFHQQ